MDIKEETLKILSDHFKIKLGEITEKTLFKDLSSDSLDFIEIIMQLEDHFKIEVPDDLAKEMTSVGDLLEFLYKKLA